jgi:hypothetical protein
LADLTPPAPSGARGHLVYPARTRSLRKTRPAHSRRPKWPLERPISSSWQYTCATKACALNTDIPLTAHAVGAYCGVKGAGWSASTTSGLTYAQTGTPTHAGGPSIGSITLLPVVEKTGAGAATASYGVYDSAAALSFSKTGSFPPMTNAPSGLEAGGLNAGGAAFAPTVAAHGAAAVSTSVRAGETVTYSLDRLRVALPPQGLIMTATSSATFTPTSGMTVLLLPRSWRAQESYRRSWRTSTPTITLSHTRRIQPLTD